MKKVIGILVIVAFAAVNLTFLTGDLTSSSIDLNSIIKSANAQTETPDDICTGTPGDCSGWTTEVHN